MHDLWQAGKDGSFPCEREYICMSTASKQAASNASNSLTSTAPITLCIINYNGAQHLRRALAALREQPWTFEEVMLVDNASDDESIAVARALCPDLRVVQLARNEGPGAARNAGFAAASCDLILFQDNDIRLEEKAVEALLHHLNEHRSALAVAPRVVYENARHIVQFDSADCHFLGLMATRHADAPVATADRQAVCTTSLVTACFLIDRQRWRGGPLFDETLGFNLEDHDFGVRATLSGHELWVEPAACVHHGSGTPGLSYRPGSRPSAQRLYYLTLNRWIIITKCYSRRTLLLLAPILVAFELLQFVWLASQGHARTWARAFRTYLARRPQLREARAQVQRMRTVQDGKLLRDACLPLTQAGRDSFAGRYLAAFADRAFRTYWRTVSAWVQRT